MKKKLKTFLLSTLFSLIPTLLIWIPFFLRVKSVWGIPLPQNGMATIVANYDGPLFIVVAKSFYNPEIIKQLISFPLPTEYYAAHFPLFPLLIKPLALVFGFPYGMLFVTVITSILAVFFFHELISLYDKKNALWLTFFFSIFPARWLIVRSVGSAEPIFIASIIASIYYFKNKNYLLAGLWGALAQLTKSPGILLFISYLFAIFLPSVKKLGTQSFDKWLKFLKLKNYLPILLIPTALCGVFLFYRIRLNDFLAYFHSGDNIHLIFPPFQIFNYSAPWVGTFWLEEILFVYLIASLGVIKLWQQKRTSLFYFSLVFFISILFVSHRDLIRYSLPIVPFLITAFSETIVKKEFKLVTIMLILPIYLFSLAYISQNAMPIADWGPLL